MQTKRLWMPFFANAIGVIAMSHNVAYAQCSLATFEPDGFETDGGGFGVSVAIDGAFLAVGAPSADGPNVPQDGGAVYVFENDGGIWTARAELIPSLPISEGYFGMSVSIDGALLAAGAPRSPWAGSHRGDVFVFWRDSAGWIEEARIVPSPQLAYDGFGFSVSLDGDRLAVGAPGVPLAYVFRRHEGTYPCKDDSDCELVGASLCASGFCDGIVWTQEASLRPAALPDGATFGSPLGLSGEHLVVRSVEENQAGERTGSVYVFRREGTSWTEVAKLIAPDPGDRGSFGYKLAIDGARIVIGAPGRDVGGLEYAGTAYIFQLTGSDWLLESTLTPKDMVRQRSFGRSVAIRNDVVAVGAYGDDAVGNLGGEIYLFRHVAGTWIQERRYAPNVATPYSKFGGSVSTTGDYVLVGTAGFASLFPVWQTFEPDCNTNDIPDGCELLGDWNHDGVVDLSDLAQFAGCTTGPQLPTPVGVPCCFFDSEFDDDVDLVDFAGIQRAMTRYP